MKPALRAGFMLRVNPIGFFSNRFVEELRKIAI